MIRIWVLAIVAVLGTAGSPAYAARDLSVCAYFLKDLEGEDPAGMAAQLWVEVDVPKHEHIGPYLKYFFVALAGMPGTMDQKVALWRHLAAFIRLHHRRVQGETWRMTELTGGDGSLIFRGGGPMIVFAPDGQVYRGEFPFDEYGVRRVEPGWVPDYSQMTNLMDLLKPPSAGSPNGYFIN